MEAGSKLRRCLFAVTIGVLGTWLAGSSDAADFRTRNFIIQAPNAQLARAVGDAAERYRSDLASYWLGNPLPPWPTPCPVRVVAGANLAAQGVTTYNRSPVRDFQMEVVGTPERILDSVLPHEVTHTILATHFGQPLPRWADEGICTTVEHRSEKQKHETKLREFLRTQRGIPMNKLFLLTEYPGDVLPMYAQGYSVCSFLIDQQGPRSFINFLHDYVQHRSWTANIRKHYGYESLAELQDYWLSWVAAGSGPSAQFAKNNQNLASDPSKVALASANPVVQAQHQTPAEAITRSVDGPATALASAQPTGWYLRQKMGVADAPAGTPPAAASEPVASGRLASEDRLMPPSVRNSTLYSAAQPQQEQSMSRSGIAFRPAVAENAKENATAVKPTIDAADLQSIRIDALQGQADRWYQKKTIWR
ncbi:M1 family metallopeptidase [Novipirellula artificiosorum]|uniref:Peptidase MA-like domain-containing protein n=1 Tax=Novipirellula artificiosorum TaxID=2528016 RepID=A0A5C6DK60_9BACT|nr:M1 family metallopeptidase [Novipirellula artificiosorum]TWU35981.1 hypothetical protein Poly41_37330 [Novipirellula artificiosorum]